MTRIREEEEECRRVPVLVHSVPVVQMCSAMHGCCAHFLPSTVLSSTYWLVPVVLGCLPVHYRAGSVLEALFATMRYIKLIDIYILHYIE